MTTELWSVEGVGYMLPVQVQWPSVEVASVTLPDIPLLKAQHNALTTALDSAGRLVDQSWIIPRIALLLIARPSTASDPEHVVRWNPDMVSVPFIDRNIDRKMAGHDELLGTLVNAGVFSTKVQADKVLRMIFKAMLSRLLVDNQPVHLGFAQLIPTPLRANWKEIVLADDIKHGCPVCVEDLDRGWFLSRTAVEKRLGDAFTDPKLLAVDRANSRIKWTLEVRLLSAFNNTVFNAELATRKRRGTGRNDYGDQIRRRLKRFQPIAIALYSNYLRAIACDHMDWRSSDGKKYLRFVSERAQDVSCIDSAASVRGNPVSLHPATEQPGVCDGSGLSAENNSVQEVPYLRQGQENMREDWSEMGGATG